MTVTPPTTDLDRSRAKLDRIAADADQTAADADQTAADADQTAADADQLSADQDEADAASDQRASDRDQASADRGRLAAVEAAADAEYEASRLERETSSLSRLASHVSRAIAARSRGRSGAERDAMATARDETAWRRDERAAAAERRITSSNAPLARKLLEIRALAAAARARAAADRRIAAQDRADAAAERLRLETELHSAHLDDLTGAMRRESGTLALTHEIDRARRGDGRFVIAFIDVDGMKRVNDELGHAAGDHVLQTLVWTMQSHLRSFDPVVRVGGDEFVCGLGGVGLPEVRRRFRSIARTVSDDVGVGISVGLATLAPKETLDEVIARADAALLRVKKRRKASKGAGVRRGLPEA